MQIKKLRSVIGLIAITVFCSVFSVMGTQAKADAQNGKKNSLPEIEYLYIESPDMGIRDTENIVVSLAQAPDEIDAVTLVYESESGQEMELKANKSEEQTYLFSKEFEKEGIYTVTKVKYTSGNAEYELLLEDEGIEASFEVGEESSEYAMFSENTDITEEEVEEAVVISDNNESAIVSDVSNALEQVSEDVVPVARSRQAKKSNVVVVLDPGHDSSHTGASGYGVKEQEATLKIAQYCKQELQQYYGITVYMTREGAECPYPETIGVSNGNVRDIEKRVQWAAEKGASSFVSFHLNSSTSSSPKGAEVYYPSSSSDGKSLAQKIENELVSLGLYNRGVKKNDTYAVIKNSIRNGFPGLIIEHAFVSNSGDASKYLSSDAKLRSLGIADATGIAKYYGLSKGVWELASNGKWKWKDGSGKYIVDSWKFISDKWYFFDKNGYMLTGWQLIDGHWYYLNGSGAMLTGWQFIDGCWYYLNGSGAMLTGWQYLDGHWYYLNGSGAMLTGLQNIGSHTCYFNSSGWMLTGWQKIENIWYYFNSSGYMLKGEQNIGGTKWYLDEKTGALYTGWRAADNKWYYHNNYGYKTIGWQKVGGCWYYMNKKGEMLTGWQFIDGHWYYMNGSGVMLAGWQFIDSHWYYMNGNGAMLTGWQLIGGHWYYMNGSGKMLTGLQKIGNQTCYFNSSGWMLTGWQKIENILYYFNGSGYMLKGEQNIGGTKWYLDEKTGALYTGWQFSDNKWHYHNNYGYKIIGWQKVGGCWYYMNEKGEMLRGWQFIGSHWYYMNGSGAMLRGWQFIDSHWYYMNGSVAMLTGWQFIGSHWYYLNGSGAMLTGWQFIGNKWYYLESSGVWNANPTSKPPIEGEPTEKPSVEEYYTIEGENTVTVEQMARWYTENSPITFPVDSYRSGGVNSLKEFCQIYYEEAQSENIRVEVAFAQAMHETGWLQFKGQVKIGQFNFAGLGATDGGASGADFSKYGTEGVRMGIRAQIQHLKAYASDTITEKTLANLCVDERFKYVTKGCAKYVEWLGQKENPQGLGWATAEGYGNKIRAQIESLKACKN